MDYDEVVWNKGIVYVEGQYEECDQFVRAGILIERLKAYEIELPKDMELMVHVNFCEKSESMNPECQKVSDLDSMTAEQDKIWYADRNPKTNDDGTDVFYSILC